LDVVRIFDRVRTATYRLSSRQEVDDHNNPAILNLGDGNVLVAYARHGRDDCWFSRKGKFDPVAGTIKWSEEISHHVGALVTYSNLHRIAHAKSTSGHRIYNFFRGINYNPTYAYSDDNGETWSQPVRFIGIGEGNVRPYVKFASNEHRIDMLFTDGHPRNMVTKVYHCYLEADQLFHTDGGRIGDFPISSDEAIAPTDATTVFEDEKQPAWVWDIKRDAKGEIAAAFVVSDDELAGEGLRYVVASASVEGEWTLHEIAPAGSCLYPDEAHYAGGMVIDPNDFDVVYFSSNAQMEQGTIRNPPNYEPSAYVLYRCRTNDGRVSISPLLGGAKGRASQLRPFAINGADSSGILLLLRGEYRTYTDYKTFVDYPNCGGSLNTISDKIPIQVKRPRSGIASNWFPF
jgi:hypothetical protein